VALAEGLNVVFIVIIGNMHTVQAFPLAVEAHCITGQHCFSAATFAYYTILGAVAKYSV